MVFSELKKLFTQKEYRLFLVLVLWLLIGFTLFQFAQFIPIWVAYAIFTPLLGICITLFTVALIFRKDIRKMSFKQIILYIVIAVIIAILFSGLWTMLYMTLFVIAIISYVLITSIFYMYGCYKYGVETDEKVYKISSPLNHILRWGIFLGGTLLAIWITWNVARMGANMAKNSPEIADAFGWIGIIIVILMILLAAIGGILVFAGKLNAWLGIFFLFVALYTTYLMFNLFYTLGSSGASYSLWMQIALYIFDVSLILYTVSSIIGEKTEVIGEKLKFIKADAILIWLIFAKASYEFAAAGVETMQVTTFNAIVGFILFIPLLFIAGFYGIINYGKRKKKMERQKG